MRITLGFAALGITGLSLAYAGFAVAGGSPPAAQLASAPGHAAHTDAVHAAGAQVKRACPDSSSADVMACMAIVRTDVAQQFKLPPGVAPPGYGPSDLQSAYNLPAASAGSGQKVAVVDAYDDPNAESDLAVYRSQYGLPACTTANGCFSKVNENGKASPLPAAAGTNGWATEESLDLDMVSAACPRCHILLVEAGSAGASDLGTAVNSAVHLGAGYVSNSYSEPESQDETSLDSAYYNHIGVVVTGSAGDDGYGSGSGSSSGYPAASADVVAVGGTTLTPDTSSVRGWSETAWSGTGSGCSAYESKPYWQSDTCRTRMANDVAADADPGTPVAVYDSYDQGGWGAFGGTGVSSPIVASAYALSGGRDPSDYSASYPTFDHAGMNDVTSGNNGTCGPAYWCTAGAGYDGPTGWGTPNGTFGLRSTFTAAAISSGIPGRCLDDYGYGSANGSKVDLYKCNYSAAQSWTVSDDGTIRAGFNDMCLDVKGQGTANGTLVDLYKCTYSANQLWTEGADGHIVSVQSGKCLDDPGWSTANGTQLEIWSCADQGNQGWYLLPVPYTGAVRSGITGKCLDDFGDGSSNGSKIDIYGCNGTAAQDWTFSSDGTVRVNGKCLYVTQNGSVNGSKVELYTCYVGSQFSYSNFEQWRLQANGNLVNLASGKCLDDPGYSTANGTQLDIWTCVNQANESWRY